MELFTNLNYRYPGSPTVAPLHPMRQHGSPHQVAPPQKLEPIQESTLDGPGYMRLDPNGISQISPRFGSYGAVHSKTTGPMKIYYMNEPTKLLDQYIPSSSDKITCTDHRPLDEIFGNLPPWSRWPQTNLGPPRNETLHHLFHSSVLTYSLPMKPQMDGVIQIPMLAVDNQISGTGLVVNFRCSDWGIGVPTEGIPMLELLHGNVSGLENPHEAVLDGFGLTDLRFNILWPHYPAFAKVISAFGTERKPLTRAELGYEVSLAFGEFFYHVTSQSVTPAQPGPYTISSSSPRSPSVGIQFDQLHLITVRNTSHGEWMAEIRAVSMPRDS